MPNRLTLLVLLLIHATYLNAQFVDISDQLPAEYVNISPNLMGGGVGIIDVNADGLEDLYFTGGSGTDALLLNTGRGFEDISVSSQVFGFTSLVHTTGIAVGDINNDGFDDIFLTTNANSENKLLINQGDNTFEDGSGTYQIPLEKVWSMAAAMGDVNRDGLLDIYVGNYIETPKAIIGDDNEIIGFDHICSPNQLLINEGDHFEDISISTQTDDDGCALATAMVDINEDGLTDIYVANDFGAWVTPNKAYLNDGNGAFTESSLSLSLSDSIYAMGISFADLNGDLKKDYYITNLGKNSLRLSTPDQSYQEVAADYGVSNTRVTEFLTTGWGTVFLDIENDGDQDLFVANGFIPSANFIRTTEEDPNKLYQNNSNGGLEDISERAGVDGVGIARGGVKADFNNDGYYDLAIANVKQQINIDGISSKVYLNDYDRANNWVGLVLKGSTSNMNAFGSKAYVYTEETVQYQELSNSGSHGSSSSQRLLFGIPQHEVVDSVVVRWPGGTLSTFYNLDKNNYYELTEGSDVVASLGCGEEFDKQWGCPSAITHLEESIANETPSVVYPNPTQGFLTISQNLHNLQLVDLQGKVLLEWQSVNKGGKLDLTSIHQGMYVLLAISPEGELFTWRIKKD